MQTTLAQAGMLYAATAVIFLAGDAAGLRFLIKPLFERETTDILLESPRLVPAIAFYLFYVAGLVYFVSAPALASGAGLLTVFLTGAFFGAIGYGVYEFTNYATLQQWTGVMVATDLAWGAFLTGVSAALGVLATRALGI